ncbi:Synerg-CTERM sorting domain-containing protein [uncultured Cloacibacillus sp.]|uniref:Synerg-CTERM sorting domain-containing protein n=1 Tax=uncultured Cloacibacillus sp. TaxID=889794 RepID=UPI0025DFD18D|nr:Synerg-CTERM sorting domain-containing protein [uncultured Cloacibacillus sp.]
MKRLCALLLTALLVSVAASCAFAAVTLSGSYYPTTADENFTVTLSQNGVSDVECYSSQYIKSWVEDEMNEGFYDSLESPTAGEIMSVFVLSDIKAPASVDSVFYNGVPDAISSQIGSLQLYFITENREDSALTTVASMPLAGAYDESKKMIALTQLPDALLARLADWDSNLMLRLTIVKTDGTPDTPDTPDTPAAPTVDIDGFVGQKEVTVSTEPQIEEGELDCGSFGIWPELLEVLGVTEMTQYKTISVLTIISLEGVDADVTFSDPCTVTAELNPGITVPEGAELRVFLQRYGGDPADTPAANALTASVMPAEARAASAPTLLDFPARYNADTRTVTFTTEGEVTIPGNMLLPVTIAAVTKPAPAPSESGSGGGGCSAGWGALALLAVVPLFARRKK